MALNGDKQMQGTDMSVPYIDDLLSPPQEAP